MEVKSIKVLTGITLAIQFLGIVLTVILRVMQGTGSLSAFCTGGIPLLLYVLFFCWLFWTSHNNTRLSAGIFLGIGILLYIGCPYIAVLENMMVAHLVSTEVFAMLASFNSACSMLCGPLYVVAFALFCFAAGGYFCSADCYTE